MTENETSEAHPPASPGVGPTPIVPPNLAGLDAAGRQLRAPWAAGIAGLLFAAFFTAAFILLRGQPIVGADDAELTQIFASGQETAGVIGGLYLAPLAGIMFLWFIAVVRDQIGEREDRFFSTVFLGSGLLFVATFFGATATASGPIVSVQYLNQPPPTAAEIDFVRAHTYSLMFAYATRAAAVFLMAMSTIGIKSGVFPLWFSRAGYVVAAVLLLIVAVWDGIILIFPAWIALISLYIMRRERARQRQAAKAEPAPGVS
jgi:hypothetical protein